MALAGVVPAAILAAMSSSALGWRPSPKSAFICRSVTTPETSRASVPRPIHWPCGVPVSR